MFGNWKIKDLKQPNSGFWNVQVVIFVQTAFALFIGYAVCASPHNLISKFSSKRAIESSNILGLFWSDHFNKDGLGLKHDQLCKTSAYCSFLTFLQSEVEWVDVILFSSKLFCFI